MAGVLPSVLRSQMIVLLEFLTIVFDINEFLIRNKTETSLWRDASMQTQAFVDFCFVLFFIFLIRPYESVPARENCFSITFI